MERFSTIWNFLLRLALFAGGVLMALGAGFWTAEYGAKLILPDHLHVQLDASIAVLPLYKKAAYGLLMLGLLTGTAGGLFLASVLLRGATWRQYGRVD